MLRREASECPLQRIAVVDRDGLVRPTRAIVPDRLEVRAPSAIAAKLFVTGIHDESMEPHLESLRVTHRGSPRHASRNACWTAS
jgi:hypothetical protein